MKKLYCKCRIAQTLRSCPSHQSCWLYHFAHNTVPWNHDKTFLQICTSTLHFCDHWLIWMVWKNKMYSQNATVPFLTLFAFSHKCSQEESQLCAGSPVYAGSLSNELTDLSYFSSQGDRQTALQPKGRVLSPSYYKKLKATNSLHIFQLFNWGIKRINHGHFSKELTFFHYLIHTILI